MTSNRPTGGAADALRGAGLGRAHARAASPAPTTHSGGPVAPTTYSGGPVAPATYSGGHVAHAAASDGAVPRHLSDVWVAPTSRGRALPTRRRPLQWLIAVPTVLALLVPFYNRTDPTLFGLPFFYWFQLACILLMIVVVALVYLLTKGRRPSWTR